MTFLAFGLARMGHDLEILHCGRPPATSLDPQWSDLYQRAGIAIRFAPPSEEGIEPRYFMRLPETSRALEAEPPDIVITQDTAAPAYIALRLRQLGFAFEDTVFIVVCYGTRVWLKDAARMVRVFPYLLGVSALEAASIELADIVVSPSNVLLQWIRRQGWQLPPNSLVIPYLSRSAATGEPQPLAPVSRGEVERIAFFGRLDEKKGLRPFAAAINALDAELLGRIELEFLGAPTQAWSPDRVLALIDEPARVSLRKITFETDLDQPEALDRLARPGTLAVMPSLGESFGNAVYECLERRIPFIASSAGATPELIAAEDHQRVLFEPTTDGVEAALRRALTNGGALRPARLAFELSSPYEQWREVIGNVTPARRRTTVERPDIDVVVVRRASERHFGRAVSALEQQTYHRINVIVVESPSEATLRAPFVVFLRDDDEPAPAFIASLVRAQAMSRADVVSCGLELSNPDRHHLFLGNPGGLGLLSNSYGGAALVRRSLLEDLVTTWPAEEDADWLLLARLHIAGAKIVSIPLPLVTRTYTPGNVESHPATALQVAESHEQALPQTLRPLARLAAGLAAAGLNQGSSAGGGALHRTARSIRRRLVRL
jgi:glycosyltransferase involved in cell wall biosynthesis